MSQKGYGLKIVIKFAKKYLTSRPFTLALTTAVFYIFSFVYFKAYQSEMSIPIVDFPLEFYLTAAGYILLYRIAEITICALVIISFYKFHENLRTKTVWYERFIYYLIPTIVYIIFILFSLKLPSYASGGYIVLSSITFCIILAICSQIQFKEIRKSQLWNSFAIPFSYILLACAIVLFLFLLPQLWGHNAAVSVIKGEPIIVLKLVNDSSGLSDKPLYLRSYQNGRYLVAKNKSFRSPFVHNFG